MTYSQFGNIEDPVVVSDISNNHHNLSFPSWLFHQTVNLGYADRWPVDSGHKQSLENDAVKLGVGPAGQEPVDLNRQPQVDILRARLGTTDLPVPLVVDINTLKTRSKHNPVKL